MTILTNCLLQDFRRKKTNSVYIALQFTAARAFLFASEMLHKCITHATFVRPLEIWKSLILNVGTGQFTTFFGGIFYMEYASNGKANAALTTGIIGTAGVGLGLLGNLLGGGMEQGGV